MKNKMKRKTRERSAFLSEEIRRAAIIIKNKLPITTFA